MKCLVLNKPSIAECLQLLEKQKPFIDLAEIRADFLHEAERKQLRDLPAQSPVPLILTFRTIRDGGKLQNDMPGRTGMIRDALKGGYAYVDLEEWLDDDELARAAVQQGTTVIRSFHDFHGIPDNFEQRLAQLPRNNHEIAKAAVYPKSSADFFRLFRIARASGHKRRVILGMGEYGFPSRVLTCSFGNEWTYCSADIESPAPGMITPEQLEHSYNYSLLNSATRIFGIIGNPVMHTKSPMLHNGWFRKSGINAVYVPFLADNAEQFVSNCSALDILGFSVTLPFKQDIIACSDNVAAGVKEIGSANTMVRADGQWYLANTDGIGFLSSLKAAKHSANIAIPGPECNALVIGAGGTAVLVIHTLVNAGCTVTVTNRTISRAEDLARQFGCTSVPHEDIVDKQFDLIVQATNVGMHPLEDKNPLPDFNFTGSELVYDVIYIPEKTIFLKKAERAGCTTMNGWQMLIGQAEEQFRLFCEVYNGNAPW